MFETRIASAAAARHDRPRDWPFAWQSVLGFWSLNFVQYVGLTLLGGAPKQLLDLYRLTPFIAGIALTLLLWPVLRASSRMGMGKRLVLAAAMSLPAAIAVTTFSVAVAYLFDPAFAGAGAELVRRDLIARAPMLIADESFNSFFFFFAWSAFYVAVSSGRRLRDAEGRAAEFERLAQSSQLAALRYQINPHFLFNTLNSLSSLVMTGRGAEAEEMILGLSDFFRATLTTDPAADVTLAEEIALQRLYLDIERIRFPDRLRVETEIPDALRGAQVPALLLQPIVENAIKYGVARTAAPVTLRIVAARDGEALTLRVENSGSDAAAAVGNAGTGVGLANVRQRLSVRFAGAASCSFGPLPDGGFRVSLTMPFVQGSQVTND